MVHDLNEEMFNLTTIKNCKTSRELSSAIINTLSVTIYFFFWPFCDLQHQLVFYELEWHRFLWQRSVAFAVKCRLCFHPSLTSRNGKWLRWQRDDPHYTAHRETWSLYNQTNMLKYPLLFLTRFVALYSVLMWSPLNMTPGISDAL